MFGSDWPVCRVAISYVDWVKTVERFTSALSAEERDAIYHRNAVRAYNLIDVKDHP
jgi:L-fuconolactonase